MTSLLMTSLRMLALLTLITGIAYPLLLTAIAQTGMSHAANGSLIMDSVGEIQGSELIGQPFSDPKYFFGRPSATSGFPSNPACGSASNLAPSNPALVDEVQQRVASLRAAGPENQTPIPLDLVTTSGSGLDPHISEAAARWQAGRIARLRGRTENDINSLITDHLQSTGFGAGSQSCVNVLRLNLAFDGLLHQRRPDRTK